MKPPRASLHSLLKDALTKWRAYREKPSQSSWREMAAAMERLESFDRFYKEKP